MKFEQMPDGLISEDSQAMSKEDSFIRKVTADDVGAIQYLATMIWADTYDGVLSKKDQVRVLRHSYSQGELMKSIQENTFLLAEVNGVAAGYVDMGIQNEVLYLHRLYVMPEFQRRGLGKQLLQEAIFQSIGLFEGSDREECSMPKVVVATVETRNPRARGFYKKMGFVEESSTTINMGGVELSAIYIVMPLP